jgi:hypothetical protein
MTDISNMDAYEIAAALEAFAEERGFVAPPACYISGSFNLLAEDGSSVYSDEGHLWCECCADKLLAKAMKLLPQEKHDDYEVCGTEAGNEDTCPHCMDCGETLAGSVSEYCVRDEIEHYSENPIEPDDEVNPRMAVELAQVMIAAGNEKDALDVGRAALVAIERERVVTADILVPA